MYLTYALAQEPCVTGASWVGTASAATVSSSPVRQEAAHAPLHQVSLTIPAIWRQFPQLITLVPVLCCLSVVYLCHLAPVSWTSNYYPVFFAQLTCYLVPILDINCMFSQHQVSPPAIWRRFPQLITLVPFFVLVAFLSFFERIFLPSSASFLN